MLTISKSLYFFSDRPCKKDSLRYKIFDDFVKRLSKHLKILSKQNNNFFLLSMGPTLLYSTVTDFSNFRETNINFTFPSIL